MNLQDFAARPATTSLPLGNLGPDLARDIQGALVILGLLDPPVDGKFGEVSKFALRAFASAAGTDLDDDVTAGLARALVAARDAGAPALDLSAGDLASRAARAMLRRGYWISHHPGCVNIAYFEGANIDGTRNDDAPNVFNDLRLVFQVRGGRPVLLGAWEATTEPGRPATLNPENPKGAARLAFSQRKAWVVGTHKLGRPTAHEALVQAEPVVVHRDFNKDGLRTGDLRDEGIFGINQHWGFDRPRDDIGLASAGCLVGRTKTGHREFMAIVKGDARFQASNGYRFLTAVMPQSALTETAFDPAQPH